MCCDPIIEFHSCVDAYPLPNQFVYMLFILTWPHTWAYIHASLYACRLYVATYTYYLYISTERACCLLVIQASCPSMVHIGGCYQHLQKLELSAFLTFFLKSFFFARPYTFLDDHYPLYSLHAFLCLFLAELTADTFSHILFKFICLCHWKALVILFFWAYVIANSKTKINNKKAGIRSNNYGMPDTGSSYDRANWLLSILLSSLGILLRLVCVH